MTNKTQKGSSLDPSWNVVISCLVNEKTALQGGLIEG